MAYSSAAGTGLRASALARQIRGPVVHEAAAPLEQVRAPIGGLDRVADPVCKRRLRHLARMVRLLGRAVPERRPEPVRYGRDPVLLKQLARASRPSSAPT